jgi:hypothetical protein
VEARSRSRTWPYTCGLKDTEAGPYLVRRARVSPEEVEDFVQRVEEELGSAAGSQVGAPVAVIEGPAPEPADDAATPGTVGVEVRVPVTRGTAPPEGFETIEVESVPVAYTVHHGAAGGLPGAEAVLAGWIRLKALRAAAEVRRVYIKRGKNPRKHVTEVQVPLAR